MPNLAHEFLKCLERWGGDETHLETCAGGEIRRTGGEGGEIGEISCRCEGGQGRNWTELSTCLVCHLNEVSELQLEQRASEAYFTCLSFPFAIAKGSKDRGRLAVNQV